MSGRGRAAVAMAWIMAACVTADAAHRYVGIPAQTYTFAGPPGMLMPTDVAVAPDGTVYVADGVRDRILAFAADASLVEEISAVGDRALAAPYGVEFAGDLLWIADSANQRVLARGRDGLLAREVRWPGADVGPEGPDLTGVALAPDGQTLWLVDNDRHRLGRLDLAGGAFGEFGEYGESLGQFAYPLAAATNADGDVFVVEAISGRVQVLTALGRPSGSIGSYGVNLGNLYRPSGVALDRDGNVWVADSTLNVIQVFSGNGVLQDVLRDEAGQPLKLEMPGGITFDAEGYLYAAELRANRVRKFALQIDPKAPPPSLARAQRPAREAQPRRCTACHLEWIEPLNRGEATALLAPPTSRPELPHVSTGPMCLSCHGGQVVDSRRRVWVEHGHRTGVTPPPTMKVAAGLPLPGGEIQCRTCHAAHTRGGAGESFADAVFLRVGNTPSDLCLNCHRDYGAGVSAGMHPLGELPAEVLPA